MVFFLKVLLKLFFVTFYGSDDSRKNAADTELLAILDYFRSLIRSLLILCLNC